MLLIESIKYNIWVIFNVLKVNCFLVTFLGGIEIFGS